MSEAQTAEQVAEPAATEGPPTDGAAPAAEAATQPAAETPAEPAAAEGALQPIIIKKIIDEGHGGAHGGAWKIALADMMTAMMAFFLLMWLLGATNTDQRKSIADYFKPTALTQSAITVNNTSGSTGLLGGKSIIDDTALPQAATQTGLLQIIQPREDTGNRDAEKDKTDGLTEEEKARIAKESDQANFEKLEKELRQKLSADSELSKLRDNVVISREREGLRIEILDKADFSMFSSGTTHLDQRARGLIEEISRSVAAMPNNLKVRGHTDSFVFKNAERNNWILSAERADVTRQIMIAKGVDEKRIARIEGVADREPFVAGNAYDPRNRRISVTLLYRD